MDFALFSCENMTRGEIEKLLSRVSAKGVSYVLATMGMHGQLLYDGSRFYDGCVKTITPVDTMGAGDSFLRLLWFPCSGKAGSTACASVKTRCRNALIMPPILPRTTV